MSDDVDTDTRYARQCDELVSEYDEDIALGLAHTGDFAIAVLSCIRGHLLESSRFFLPDECNGCFRAAWSWKQHQKYWVFDTVQNPIKQSYEWTIELSVGMRVIPSRRPWVLRIKGMAAAQLIGKQLEWVAAMDSVAEKMSSVWGPRSEYCTHSPGMCKSCGELAGVSVKGECHSCQWGREAAEKDAARAEQQARRLAKSLAERERSKMSKKLRYSILERDGGRCVLCGMGPEDGVALHVDHVIPVSAGGLTEHSNLRCLCSACNLGKGSKVTNS